MALFTSDWVVKDLGKLINYSLYLDKKTLAIEYFTVICLPYLLPAVPVAQVSFQKESLQSENF